MMKLYRISDGKVQEIQSVDKEIAIRLFSGVGLFETTKILKGKPVFIKEHVRRIVNSSKNIWGKYPDPETIISASVLVSSELEIGMLRIFLVEDNLNFHIFLLTDDFPYSKTSNLTIQILPYERNPNSFSSGLKPISYFENVVLRERLKRENIDEGIFLSGGFIAEGTRTNIFWVKDGKIFTPPLNLGILSGITRSKTIVICKEKLSIEVSEEFVKPEDIMDADEVFLSGSVLGVGSVGKIIHNGKERIFDIDKFHLSSIIRDELYKMELEDIQLLSEFWSDPSENEIR